MIDGMKVVAVIPARGGSKSIPKKNIAMVAGKPLIAYTIEVALQSKYIDRVIVSTDDREIADISKHCGAEVPFMRPAEYATDDATTLSVLQHAIKWLEDNEGYEPEVILILEPTSPLRIADDVDGAIKLLADTDCDSVTGLCEVEHNPYRMRTIVEGRVHNFIDSPVAYAKRQDLPPVYRHSGTIYITRTRIVKDENRIFGDDNRAFMVPLERSIDIDGRFELEIADMILRKRKV